MPGTQSTYGAQPSYGAQYAQPAANIDAVLKQAEESSVAYQNLVAQLAELVQQRRNGTVAGTVFDNAWRQLVSSHPDGERAGNEALIMVTKRYLAMRNSGSISSEQCTVECDFIAASFPNGATAVCEAEIEDLNERLNFGQVSQAVYSMRMAEFQKKHDELIKAAGIPQGSVNPNDSGSAGYAVLGFFAPIVGLILYLVWKSDRPKDAHQAGVGAIAGVVTTIVLYLIYIIVIYVWTSSVVSSVATYR